MDFIFDFILDFIDPLYLVSFVLLSYGYKKMLSDSLQKSKIFITNTYATFVIGIIFGVIFYFLNHGSEPTNIAIKKLISTYAIGTSLYELIVKWLIDRFEKMFDGKTPDNTSNNLPK